MEYINCLMLKTADQRLFFTHEENYPQLVEFARTCNAEISLVKMKGLTVMDLHELAQSICNHAQQNELPQYEVIQIKSIRKKRQDVLGKAACIRDYIRSKFIDGDQVSLSDLENKFEDLSRTTLRSHIRKSRKELIRSGYKIDKVKKGTYQLSKKCFYCNGNGVTSHGGVTRTCHLCIKS